MSQEQLKVPIGQSSTILNSSVIIHPRQRKGYDPDKIKELAGSIRRTEGLIHPIVLDPADMSLVAGGRRRKAYFHLQENYPNDGWELIPYIFKDQQSKLFRKVCELEENLQRLNLEWWESAAAIAEIDSVQKELAEARGETWDYRKTAEMVGVSLGTVANSVSVDKETKSNPKVKENKTLTGALSKIKTEKQIAKRKEELEAKVKGKIKTFPAEIIQGDSADLIMKEPDEEYDAIVTNFPFGIEYGYSGRAEKVYEDEEGYIVDLVQTIVKEGYRVLKDDSWFVAFFDIRKITYSNPAMRFYKKVMENLSKFPKEERERIAKMGFDSLGLSHWFKAAGFSFVQVMPCIWVKPNKTLGNIGDPRKGQIVAYEAFIFAAKGDAALLKQGRNNIYTYDTLDPSERDFAMQMPASLCAEIISMISLGKGRILDPFAGSGGIGEGALDRQCSFKGFELNKDRAEVGNLRLREHLYAKVEQNASS